MCRIVWIIFICVMCKAGLYASPDKAELTLEIPSSSSWGLMQRSNLPDNQGMLFQIRSGTHMWMFNCIIDLSLAFLDKNGVILSLHEMKAYPNMMDPSRPVDSPTDFSKYTANEPIILFFKSQAVKAPQKTRYAIEMEKNWFKEKEIEVGDKVLWNKRNLQPATFTFAKIRSLPKNPQ